MRSRSRSTAASPAARPPHAASFAGDGSYARAVTGTSRFHAVAHRDRPGPPAATWAPGPRRRGAAPSGTVRSALVHACAAAGRRRRRAAPCPGGSAHIFEGRRDQVGSRKRAAHRAAQRLPAERRRPILRSRSRRWRRPRRRRGSMAPRLPGSCTPTATSTSGGRRKHQACAIHGRACREGDDARGRAHGAERVEDGAAVTVTTRVPRPAQAVQQPSTRAGPRRNAARRSTAATSMRMPAVERRRDQVRAVEQDRHVRAGRRAASRNRRTSAFWRLVIRSTLP